MNALKTASALIFALAATACGSTSNKDPLVSTPPSANEDASAEAGLNEQKLAVASGQFLTTISHNGVSMKVVINKPTTPTADVIMTFHGTVETDDKIVSAAKKTLEETKKMVPRSDIL